MLKKFSWFSAGLFLITALLLTTCKKENNDLGLEIQPPGDKLNVHSIDTTAVIAYSQIVDSVKTDETSVSLLGSMVDPVFGRSTASFYTQFRLSESAYDFGITPYPDSLVLSLKYDGFYGDSTAVMTVKVYELAGQIQLDSLYYSNQSVAVKETLLGQKTFTPDFSSNVIIGVDTLDPHLRIHLGSLTSTLASKLLTAPADSMADNKSFLNYFYGLYVTAEPANSGGSIIYLDLLSSVSEMTLYYHNGTDDSLKFEYLINSNCARFGNFTHDYSLGDPAFKAQVIDKDTTLGKSICYVQALGGVKTFVRFPYIKNYYANGNIAVNEARLFLSCYEPDPGLDVASTLVLVKRKAEGGYSITDDQLEGEGYFGGYYDKNNHGYWFRITNTIQELMRSADPDYGLEVYVSGGAVNAQRVLLSGKSPQLPIAPEDRMKLIITYTTLN
ncbi:MAG: DUF4270 domain-containing protein [Bacteroidales bacterium]|nr:DUF4270 domain-containing protein [Bacteroidales bacterium]